MMRFILATALLSLTFGVFAEIKVSDVKVFSGYPWKEVVIGYTITGTDANADAVRLTAMDKAANKSYVAKNLAGAKLTEGRHVLRWNAAVEGVSFSSANTEFAVSILACGGVQLWANGPYWAECNVGATKPEEYGYYFWWGGTVAYQRNAGNTGWVSVKSGGSFIFNESNCPTSDKSDSLLQSQGYIDPTGNLVAENDAATSWLGAPWRMPTKEEWESLENNCTITWTERNGVFGRQVTGKGGYESQSIFLPAAGYGFESLLNLSGSWGEYWSSTSSGNSSGAWCCVLYSTNFAQYSCSRYCGLSVRPIRGFAQ